MPELTGNLIVGQSGGPTAVINNSLAGVVQEATRHSAIKDIYGMVHGIEGVLNENLVDLRAEKPETIEGLRQTPSAALGACRTKLKDADYERIIKVLQAHDIRYFMYVGGNDSADTCHHVEKLAQESGYELRAIAAPKTVDNDLAYTDHCPGYGSVARFNAIATRDAGRDTEAIGIVDNVKIVETMGRNTGWITASTALAKEGPDDAPHLIYLPERPFDMDKFLEDVKATFDRLGHCLITVCEGLRDEKGEELVASKRAVDTDGFGHKQLGGVADFLCDAIATNLKIKARFDKPGTIQRMSILAASPVDQEEAYLVGKQAVAAAVDGVSGQMITLVRESNSPYRVSTGMAPLEEVANAEKPVPPEFINERGNFVTEAFIEYARPLIGGPLPTYARLKGRRVPPKL
ncbi:MAG: 6-phosphofructokinase [Armatimonadota bacterium]|nr:MAG: 6-phosphofructokinase [Armatimonadota bacterium]